MSALGLSGRSGVKSADGRGGVKNADGRGELLIFSESVGARTSYNNLDQQRPLSTEVAMLRCQSEFTD